jgi:hypothetical protein
MDALETLALIGAGLFAVAILIAPLFLSWPLRLRWTISQSLLAGTAPACALLLDLREVTLERVDATEVALVVTVLEVGRGQRDTMTLEGPAIDDERTTMLEEWSALRTPMLLFLDRTTASLTGPAASVTGLHPVQVSLHA